VLLSAGRETAYMDETIFTSAFTACMHKWLGLIFLLVFNHFGRPTRLSVVPGNKVRRRAWCK
jgi:hypothetical protein